MLVERGRYELDRRAMARNAGRDLLALVAVLVLGMPLFEIALVLVIDAAVRAGEHALQIRQARGRPRGQVESPVFHRGDGAVNHADPAELAKAALTFSVFVVGFCGFMILLWIGTTHGTGGIEPVRAAIVSALYTVPFALYEHLRWMREKREAAVPHLLARNLFFLSLFLSVFATMFLGAILGIVTFVLLRSLSDTMEIRPEWSVDGEAWSADWRGEWDGLRTDRIPRP